MISPQLQTKLHLMELAVWPTWLKSSKKLREKITKDLGKRQAEMILEEIEREANNLVINKQKEL